MAAVAARSGRTSRLSCRRVARAALACCVSARTRSRVGVRTRPQLFVSIQALILVKYPYFNEPGVEAQMGTPEGNEGARVGENGGYEHLRVATIQWAMIDQLRHPAAGFEQVHVRVRCGRACPVCVSRFAVPVCARATAVARTHARTPPPCLRLSASISASRRSTSCRL